MSIPQFLCAVCSLPVTTPIGWGSVAGFCNKCRPNLRTRTRDGGTATTILRDSTAQGHARYASPDTKDVCPICSTPLLDNQRLAEYQGKPAHHHCVEAIVVRAGSTATTILRDGGPIEATDRLKGPDRESIPPADKAADLLDEAKKIVTGARRQAYGNPEDNFQRIADMWNVYLSIRFRDTPANAAVLSTMDVCQLMILMKTVRLVESPNHHDSLVDQAGYAACAARLQK